MRNHSLVSPGLLKSGLKRFWPLWLAGFVSVLLYIDVPLYASVTETIRSSDTLVEQTANVEGMWTIMHVESWFYAFAAAIIVSIALGEHLFDSRSATFVGSLPMRRPQLFVTHYLTGLIPLLAIPALVGLCLVPLHLIAGTVFPLVGIARWWLLTALLAFSFYAFAQLACQLAGSRAVAVLLYGVIDFLAVALGEAVQLAAASLMYGLSLGTPIPYRLSPGAWLFMSVVGGVDSSPNWPSLVTYALAAAAFAAIACLLFARRDLESAGDSIAFAPVRPFLKYLAGVSMALLFSSVFCLLFLSDGMPADTGEVVVLAAMLVVGGFFGVLFAEMIMSRSARVLGKCWRDALVVMAAGLAFVGVCFFDPFGVARYVPEPDDVSEVTVDCSLIDTAGTFTSPEAIAEACELHRDIIAFGGRGEDLSGYIQITFSYKLEGDRLVERQYLIPSGYFQYLEGEREADEGSLLIERMLAMQDSPEGRASRFASVLGERPRDFSFELEYRSSADDDMYTSVTLKPEECESLIEGGLRQDLLEGIAGEAYPRYDSEGELDATLRAHVTSERGETEQPFSMQLSERTCPHTVAWIREHYPEIELLPWW